MPLPKAVGRLHRIGINRVTRYLAGETPPAMVIHRGRRSGRDCRTPIMAFPCEGGFVIALTHGWDTGWERNVRAGVGALISRSVRIGALLRFSVGRVS